MKIKNILNIILFVFFSIVLLLSLSGCSKTEIPTSTQLEVDTSYDAALASINTALEKHEDYKYVDSILKNLKSDAHSYKLNIFCRENNDIKLRNERAKRIYQIEAKYGKL